MFQSLEEVVTLAKILALSNHSLLGRYQGLVVGESGRTLDVFPLRNFGDLFESD